MSTTHESQFIPCKHHPQSINCEHTAQQRQCKREGGDPCELCGWSPKVEKRRKLENEVKYGSTGYYAAMEAIAEDFKCARITRENAERKLKKICHKLLDN